MKLPKQTTIKCPECKRCMELDKIIRGDYKYYCKNCEELYELDFEDYIPDKDTGAIDNKNHL